MNQIIFACASYLIYISVFYTFYFFFLRGNKKHSIQEFILVMGGASVSWILGHFLKNIIAHPRPDLAYALVEPNDIYSFPSGHASFMFALGFLMSKINVTTGRNILVLALITGVARVLAGVHYWYDIVGGLVLGYGVAYVIFFLYKKYFHRI